MSASKIVRARNAGWCAAEFAHPGQIEPGDRTLVITYFPRDEHVQDFGVKPFARFRHCAWCLAREEETGWRIYPCPPVSGPVDPTKEDKN